VLASAVFDESHPDDTVTTAREIIDSVFNVSRRPSRIARKGFEVILARASIMPSGWTRRQARGILRQPDKYLIALGISSSISFFGFQSEVIGGLLIPVKPVFGAVNPEY